MSTWTEERSAGAGDDALRRMGALGQQLARAPFRVPLAVMGALAQPVRASVHRDVLRSLGEPDPDFAPEQDPELAYLRPDGVARRVHNDLPSMLVGGLSALLLQTLHPLVMAGVAEHSNYAQDPVGRFRRTATFVTRTTFGTVEEAERAARQVRNVHRRVKGVAPDGRPYSASDPDLVTWVHVAEVASFLAASQRYGPRRLSPGEVADYYAEMATVAYSLGAEWVPRSADEVAAYFARVRPELYAGPQAMAAKGFILRGLATRPEERLVYTVLASAAVSVLPGWARRELRLPAVPLLDPLVVVPATRAFCAGLRWAVAPDPAAEGG